MPNFRCPMCGVLLHVEAQSLGPEGGWQRQEWNNFAADLGPATPLSAGTSWHKREPARPPTAADVGVPAAWAGLTGVACSLLSIPITIWSEWPWWAPLVVLGGGAAITWLMLLVRWQNLLWRIEEIIGIDLDGDKIPGYPAKQTPIQIEITDQNQKSIRFIDLPIADEQMQRIAIAMSNGASFSRRGLAGVISDNDYRILSEVMINAGLLRWKNDKPNQGGELTAAGRAVLGHYLNH